MFELLKNELRKDFDEQEAKVRRAIIFDEDICYAKHNSTDLRWRQYEAGEISETQMREFAFSRRQKQLIKEYGKKLVMLDNAEKAGDLIRIDITVEFSKEHHPTASVTVESTDGFMDFTAKATGYGYDKESSAVASAMNKSFAIMRELYNLKEELLSEGLNFRDEEVATGWDNREHIGYGAGYSVLPYFEGAVGCNCYWSIFKKMGWEVLENYRAKNVNFYSIYKAG